MEFVLTKFEFTSEFLVAMFGFASTVLIYIGISKTLLKKSEQRMDKMEKTQEEHGRILFDVVKSQAVLDEKLDSLKDLIRHIFKGKIL